MGDQSAAQPRTDALTGKRKEIDDLPVNHLPPQKRRLAPSIKKKKRKKPKEEGREKKLQIPKLGSEGWGGEVLISVSRGPPDITYPGPL